MRYWKALWESVGGKWILLPGFLSGTIGLWEAFRGWGLSFLPELSGWAIAFFAMLPISSWVIGGILIKIVKLEKKLEPKISLSDPNFTTLPKLAKGKAKRTYSLKVTNESGELIKNCQVKLVEMLNVRDEPSKERGRPFKLSTESPPESLIGAVQHAQKFDIAPNDFIDIDIVYYNELSSTNLIRMCYALQGAMDHAVYVGIHKEDCPHRLTIRAIADNTVPVETKLKYWLEEGMLRLEKI